MTSLIRNVSEEISEDLQVSWVPTWQGYPQDRTRGASYSLYPTKLRVLASGFYWQHLLDSGAVQDEL